MKFNDKDSSLEDLDQKSKELGMGGFLVSDKDKKKYKERMKRRKEIQIKRVGERSLEKGLIIVFTGQGKGKTTASLGMALRTLGHGENVAIIQFIKGGWEPGESKALRVYGESLKWHAFGEGFTWETQNRIRDKELVLKAWEQSSIYLLSETHKLVILDEINVAIKLGYLPLENVIDGLIKKPPMTHVVLTGRGAPQKLLDHADLVTEMKLVHHPFKEQGVKAQKGIEF